MVGVQKRNGGSISYMFSLFEDSLESVRLFVSAKLDMMHSIMEASGF